MKVTVLFFGVLTDITGTGTKIYSDVGDMEQLKMRITDDFPQAAHYNFRMSLNNEIAEENMTLKDGDEVACLPPFAGG
jgi:molybdopterin converting factor small subunit